ncbi:MAG: PAS domain-containing protein [Hyphomonadaceae bacterium]|nr:PAS domain-containing protein [Hyphomonadaceae bacterium]
MGVSLYKSIFHSMPNAAMILDADLKFVDANQAYCEAVQKRQDELLGFGIFEVFPDTPERVAGVKAIFEKTLDGEPTMLEAQPYQLRYPDGHVEERLWQIAQFPVQCEETGGLYMVQRAEDVTEREALRRQRDLVTAELNHRVRNTLAVVQSVADHTGLASSDIDSFLSSFTGRLAAISRNFAALTDAHWEGLDYETILRTELEPYAGPVLDRISMNGPDVTLTVRASKFTSMLVHELITNASKYGFLTTPEGRLSLRWWLDEDLLHGEWLESGVHGVKPPGRTGFGFQLFEMMENIDITHEFLPDGIKLHFSVPIELSVAGSSEALASA